jgi:uncharacterized protein YraI
MRKTLVSGLCALAALVAAALLLSGARTQAAPADQLQFGTGWTAQYFNNTGLSGAPVFTTSAPNGVNFNWGTGSPDATVQVDNFSARFTSIQFFNAGVYEFIAVSDDGIRVQIDGVTVLDRFQPRVLTEDRFQQTLTAGTHAITVEYVEFGDQAIVQFQWQQVAGTVVGTPGIGTPGVSVFPTPFGTPPATPGPTPTATRIPPTALPAIPPGALTGTVVRASVLLVRVAPFLGAPVVGRVLRGQTYQVLGRDEDARWFLLQLSGFQGWVWGFYLFVNGNEFNAPVLSSFVTAGDPAAATGVVGQTNAVLRLRAEPNTTSAQIGRVPWGDILPILARTNNGWVQVVFRGTTGWVAAEFVNVIEGDIATVPVR